MKNEDSESILAAVTVTVAIIIVVSSLLVTLYVGFVGFYGALFEGLKPDQAQFASMVVSAWLFLAAATMHFGGGKNGS